MVTATAQEGGDIMANDDIIANAQAAAQTPANGAPVPEPQQTAPQSAAAARVAELNKPGDEGIFSRDLAKQKEAMVQLKAALAAAETNDEKSIRSSLTVAERREEFGVEPPMLPKPWLDEYNADYQSHENSLYDLAHSTGMGASQVRSLRDLGVTLGQRVLDTQAPIPEADLAVEFARLGIPASQRPALVKLWRAIESGPTS
jgi:hypothetical protein